MKNFFIAFIFIFFLTVFSVHALPSVSIDSPINGFTYNQPDVPLNFTFSDEDLGRIYYSFNEGDNETIGYEISEVTEVLGVVPGGASVTGLYADNEDRLLASLDSGVVTVYDIDDLSFLGNLTGDGSAFLSVYGDGNFVFASTASGRVGIWNLPSTTPVANLLVSNQPINRVNADDDYLFMAGNDSSVYVYNKAGVFQDTLTEPTDAVLDVYSDEQYIYGASADSNVYVWDISDFSFVTTLTDATDSVTTVRSSDDYIQGGSLDDNVYFWNKGDFSLYVTNGDIFGDMFQFDKDGENLLVGDSYGDVTVFTLNGTFVGYYVGHDNTNTLAVYSDNDYIYSAGDNGVIERKNKTYDSVILPTVEGENTLELFTYDNRERLAQNSSTFTVNVPFPQITISQPVEGFTYNHSFRDLIWSHNVPSVSWGGYSLNGGENVTFTSLFPPNLLDHIAQDSDARSIESDDNYFYVAERFNSRIAVYDKDDLSFVTYLDSGGTGVNGLIEYRDKIYEANQNCKVYVWNKADFTLEADLDSGLSGSSCAFQVLHQDGEKLYGGQEAFGSGNLVAWNLTSENFELLTVKNATGIPFAIDTDDDYLYVGDLNITYDGGNISSYQGTVRIVNKTDFTVDQVFQSNQNGIINDLEVDDTNIYVAKQGPLGYDGRIFVVNKSDKSDYEVIHSMTDIKAFYVDRDFIYSSGSLFESGDNNLLIWDIDNLNLIHTITEPEHTITAMHSDRDYLYVGTDGGEIGGFYVYDSLNPIRDFKAREGSNTITLYLNDTFGNANSTTINFEVDTELLFNPTMLDNSHDSFLFQFRLLNNYLGDGNFSWSVDFGDGTILNSSEDVFLFEYEDVFIITGHTYSSPGQYTVTAFATNGTVSDQKSGTVNTV